LPLIAQQNTDRILTTHVGSLPRRLKLLDMMKTKLAGSDYDKDAYEACVRDEVAECVRRQAETGIDILTDGEQSKAGFSAYVRERLGGFELRPGAKIDLFAAEVAAFPEYYEQYFKTAMFGGGVVPSAPMFCVGPVTYRGEAELRRDIANLKAAAAKVPHKAVFMPAIAPSGVGKNEYYPTEEEFINALGRRCALNTRRSPMPAFCCRSTIRSCLTSLPTRRWTRSSATSVPICTSKR
jgi:5-methyltetrahydropteroyltriglutamate--homocysteine methyltransferase